MSGGEGQDDSALEYVPAAQAKVAAVARRVIAVKAARLHRMVDSFGLLEALDKRFSSEKPSDRLDFLNSNEAWKQIDYFASQFNSWDFGTTGPKIVATLAPHALGCQMGKHLQESSTKTFDNTIPFLDNNPGYHILQMVLEEVNTNHLCALHQNDTMTFFDPNSGEYSIKKGNRVAFFKNLATQYGTYVFSTGKSQPLTFSSVFFCHLAYP